MNDRSGAIAIVGMGCVFPGAPDVATYWSNIVEGVDAIEAVPDTRWDPLYFDPDAAGVDRFYCRRGGFVDAHATVNPTAFGLMPLSAAAIEPDQLLSLVAAKEALDDAGATFSDLARERTAVILGRSGLPTVPLVRLDQRVRTSEQLLECLRALQPGITEADLHEIKRSFVEQLGPFRPESAVEVSTNLAASRIANRLDFHGPAYTVDAACASTLVAIDQACRELGSNRCDAVLAGGASLCDDVTLWSAFTQLGAISPSETIRPFDRRADGLLIGEGVGILLLERLEDAERAGRRVYAVLKGTGIASDGRATTLMAPDASGQVRALERAWAEAKMDPAEIALLEAHGTGTPAGDAAELETVRRFFGPAAAGVTRGIGSVKSMIGHAMAAAGAAGLIKAALAVHHGVLPPTLHCEEPRPGVAETAFRPITETIDWPRATSRRVAAVNAFGFGGINSHAVLESHGRTVTRARRPAPEFRTMLPRQIRTPDRSAAPPNALFVAASDATGLLTRLEDPVPVPPAEDRSGTMRLSIVDPTPEKVEFARKLVQRGRPWRGRRDVWFSPEGLISQGGSVAFLFPGIEGQVQARVDDVAARFGWDAPDFERTAGPQDVHALAHASLQLSLFCYAALCELGITPSVMAGQSIGEWAGMVAAKIVPPEALDDFVDTLDPRSFHFPDVVYAAVGSDVNTVCAELAELDRVEVTHDNCPHQTVICGPEEDVVVALARLKDRHVFGAMLPFRSGFHGSWILPHLAPFAEAIGRVPLQPGTVPLWSATTCEPYPAEAVDIRELELAHLGQRVRFRELVQRLYERGTRCFVQVGAGSLVGFVEDTLRGEDFAVVSCVNPKNSGLEQLLRVAAALWTEGAPGIRLADLISKDARASDGGSPGPGATVQRLRLGLPLVRLRPQQGALSGRPAPPARRPSVRARHAFGQDPGAAPVSAAFDALLGELESAAADVVGALGEPARHAASVAPTTIVRSVELSLDRFPSLRDHSLVRVPDGWADDADRFAVVPLTMALELMVGVASELCPGLVPVAAVDVVAMRWLEVVPPLTVDIEATLVNGDGGRPRTEADGRRVDVTIKGFCRCTAVFAPTYATPPPRAAASLGQLLSDVPTPEVLYETGQLFHGPAYRGLLAIGPVGEHGLDAVVTGSTAPGALLDNAGQVVGCWICLTVPTNRVAFPVAVERIEFYGPTPSPGERGRVEMRVLSCMPNSIRVTVDLFSDRGLWAHVEGWEERRFESDEIVWSFVTDPTHGYLSEQRRGGWSRATEHWRTGASRDLLMRMILTGPERAEYGRRRPGTDQRQWLLGRIAAKDAVRRWCADHGYRPLHPLEVVITNDEAGRPLVHTPFDLDLRVSLAHSRLVAVAIADPLDVGIDIEHIEDRSDGFVGATYEPLERDVLLRGTRSDAERAYRITAGWSAKEAVAKASGHGLGGRPKDFVLSAREADRLWVNGIQVDMAREDDYVVAWTVRTDEGSR